MGDLIGAAVSAVMCQVLKSLLMDSAKGVASVLMKSCSNKVCSFRLRLRWSSGFGSFWSFNDVVRSEFRSDFDEKTLIMQSGDWLFSFMRVKRVVLRYQLLLSSLSFSQLDLSQMDIPCCEGVEFSTEIKLSQWTLLSENTTVWCSPQKSVVQSDLQAGQRSVWIGHCCGISSIGCCSFLMMTSPKMFTKHLVYV